MVSFLSFSFQISILFCWTFLLIPKKQRSGCPNYFQLLSLNVSYISEEAASSWMLTLTILSMVSNVYLTGGIRMKLQLLTVPPPEAPSREETFVCFRPVYLDDREICGRSFIKTRLEWSLFSSENGIYPHKPSNGGWKTDALRLTTTPRHPFDMGPRCTNIRMSRRLLLFLPPMGEGFPPLPVVFVGTTVFHLSVGSAAPLKAGDQPSLKVVHHVGELLT